MIPIWWFSEGARVTSVPINYSLPTILWYATNGIVHFLQNWTAFTVLVQVTPVTYSIASLIKRIVVIIFTLIWFGDPIAITQGFGITLACYGLYLYQSAMNLDSVDNTIGLQTPPTYDARARHHGHKIS